MEQSISVSSPAIQAPRLGAGFGVRAGAQIVDLIIHNVMGLVIGVMVGILIGIYSIAAETSPSILVAKLEATSPIGYILALLGYVVYHAICEGMHGATLGKLIFKIHVLKEDGNPASIGSALIRSLAFYIDALFFGLVAAASMRSSELQQRLGDKAAKTVVVERSSFNPYQWPSGWKFVLVFLLAIAADGFIFFLSLILKLL
jgi:uncharacterized RDD family membrane protein YckC